MNIHSVNDIGTSSFPSTNNENEGASFLEATTGLPKFVSEKESSNWTKDEDVNEGVSQLRIVTDLFEKKIEKNVPVLSFNPSSASMVEGDEKFRKKSRAIFNIKFNAESFEYPD